MTSKVKIGIKRKSNTLDSYFTNNSSESGCSSNEQFTPTEIAIDEDIVTETDNSINIYDIGLFLGKKMCVAECVYNASLENCNCVDPNIMYHHNSRICTEDELNECFFFNVSECYSDCQQPCEFTDFEYDVQERVLEHPSYRSVEDFKSDDPVSKRAAVMLIFLKRPEVIIYSHRPQYEDIEVFSFLGGYVGMWLGISLIAVFDFLESVVLIFCFWIKKKL